MEAQPCKAGLGAVADTASVYVRLSCLSRTEDLLCVQQRWQRLITPILGWNLDGAAAPHSCCSALTFASEHCAGAPLAATSQLSAHWGNILAVLDGLLATLRANHCPAFLVRKLFQQLFSFVNVQARPRSPHPAISVKFASFCCHSNFSPASPWLSYAGMGEVPARLVRQVGILSVSRLPCLRSLQNPGQHTGLKASVKRHCASGAQVHVA